MRLLGSLLLCAAAAFAQGTAPARKNVVGEVQSADPAAKQLKIKTDAGAIYTITADDHTKYMKVGPDLDLKKASNIEAGEIATGDRVLTRGVVNDDEKSIAATSVVVMSKTDVAKKQQRDVAEWSRRGVAGTVTALDASKHEITIKVNTIPPKTVTVDASGKVEFRRYAPDSVKFSDAKPSSFSDLQPGDGLRVLGNKNDDGTRYTAEEIVSGSFRTLAVQVVSIDPETHTIKATDLTTKQKTPVTIQVSSETSMHRISERAAMMLASVMNAGQGGAPGGPAGAPGGPGGTQRRPDGAPAAAPDGSKGVGLNGAGTPAASRVPGGPEGAGGPGGAGGRGFGGGRGDLQQMLEHMPTIAISELKPGDALVISSTNGADRSHLTAISIVAGVEPFLAAAPKSAGAVNLGSWSFDIPAQ